MREVRDPDALFVVEVEMCEESNRDVIRALLHTYPESIALENVSDTHVTVFSREDAILYDVHQLLQEGKVTQYTVK